MRYWLFLSIAILAEVIGTSALKVSDGFSKFWPSMIVICGYGVSFYFLSLTLRAIPVGVAYAVWAGVGMILITLTGRLFFDQHLDFPAIFGIMLIIAGVLVMNVFSKAVPH